MQRLVILGDVDPEEAIAAVAKRFEYYSQDRTSPPLEAYCNDDMLSARLLYIGI